LDPDRDPSTVRREFERLKSVARRRGYAVGIGHPYTETLDFLAVALPLLEADGIDLVPVGRLIEGMYAVNGQSAITAGE
ncbi:MAG: divergent polysaccharide deacetylase family protein, partial [Gammaproteobacteria bacterium]|nr:divergent polysaccharide deacetylase family protein [Gammaproteobacteria bacterium]